MLSACVVGYRLNCGFLLSCLGRCRATASRSLRVCSAVAPVASAIPSTWQCPITLGTGGQHASTTATDHAELAHRPRRDSPPGGRWDGALPPTPATVAAAPFRLSRRPARPARAISSVSRWTRSPMCCRTVLSWPTELGVCAGAPRDVTGTPKPFGPSLLRQTTLGLVRHPVGLATPDRAAARGQPSTPTAVPTSRSSAPGRRVVAPPRGGRRDEAPRHPGGLSIRPRV